MENGFQVKMFELNPKSAEVFRRKKGMKNVLAGECWRRGTEKLKSGRSLVKFHVYLLGPGSVTPSS